MPLTLDLSRLREGRLEQDFRIPPGSDVLAGYDLEVREPLVLEAELRHPSSRTYVLNARLRGTVFAPCRRCLTPVGVPIDEEFRVVYQEPGRDAERGEDAGDEDIVWFEPGAMRIEITREVRDRLFLESEHYPLCRPECAGFCPVCGQNLNEARCDCVVETVDTRWKALEGLDFGGGESD